MKLDARTLLLNFTALAFSVIPPLIATVSYFPLFIAKGSGSVISGVALILTILSASPLLKFIKRILDSPSARTVWIVTFILFFVLGRIADEMTVIAFVGAVSNIIGSIFFALAKRRRINEKQA